MDRIMVQNGVSEPHIPSAEQILAGEDEFLVRSLKSGGCELVIGLPALPSLDSLQWLVAQADRAYLLQSLMPFPVLSKRDFMEKLADYIQMLMGTPASVAHRAAMTAIGIVLADKSSLAVNKIEFEKRGFVSRG